MTPDYPDCNLFPLNTGFHYALVPFKTDFTVVTIHEIVKYVSSVYVLSLR